MSPKNNLFPVDYLEPEGFFYFCRDIIGLSDMTERTHKPICDFIAEDSVKVKMVMVPRDTFKTSIASIAYPIWLILRNVILFNNPMITICLDSEGKKHTQKSLDVIKKKLRYDKKITEEFINCYDDGKEKGIFLAESLTIAQRISLEKKTGVVKREHTVDISGIGAVITGNHYDYVIADDWVGATSYRTETKRQGGIEHYKEIENVVDKDNGKLLILCTPWIVGDAYSYIASIHGIEPAEIGGKPNILKGLNFALYNASAYWENEEGEKEYFFPERLNEERLDHLKLSLGNLFYTQYLCSYISEQRRVFIAEGYQEIEPEFIPNDLHNCVISMDVTSQQKTKEMPDYTAIGAVAMDGKGDYYLLDCWAKQYCEVEEVINALFSLYIRASAYTKVSYALMEKGAYIGWLQYAITEKMHKEGLFIRVCYHEIPRNIDKYTRISRIAPDWNMKHIFINTAIPAETRKLIRDQFLDFGQTKFDDIPDMMELALRRMGRIQIQAYEEKRRKQTIIQSTKTGIVINLEGILDDRERKMVRENRKKQSSYR